MPCAWISVKKTDAYDLAVDFPRIHGTGTNQLNVGTEHVASPMDPMGLCDSGTHLICERKNRMTVIAW